MDQNNIEKVANEEKQNTNKFEININFNNIKIKIFLDGIK